MTLQCTCGSPALEFEEQSYPDNGLAYEQYRCQACNRTGSYTFGEQNGRHVERMTGCLTENGEY